MKKSDLRDWKMRLLGALLCLTLGVFPGARAQASLIQIDFSAAVDFSDGGGTQNVVGQLVLDTTIPFTYNVGAVDGPVVGGFLGVGDEVFEVDPNAGESFVAAAQRSGYGYITLLGGFDEGFFSLELAATDWFPTDSVWDVLQPELDLGQLIGLDSGFPEPTQLLIFLGSVPLNSGGLSFLQISEIPGIPEPSMTMLSLLGGLAFLYSVRRRRIVVVRN